MRLELEELSQQLNLTDNIRFMGFRPDRLNFLRGFDTFILPSRLEGIPRCLMESMAAGVPIIASDIPGCNDLIHNNKTGLLFEVDNHRMLAGVIRKIAASQELRTALAANANMYVNENYSANRMAKEYESLFEELCGG